MNKIEKYIIGELPIGYKSFLKQHTNEYQNDLVILYLADDVVERNETLQTKEFAPGYIAIGDDSGGNAFLLKLGEKEYNVYVVSMGSMDPDDMELVSNNFNSWLTSNCKYE